MMTRNKAPSLAIVNGTVIDGTGAGPVRGGSVLIENNRIDAVQRGEKLSLKSGTQVIDAGGRTVMPGLIDSHTHDTADPSIRREFLKAGITSVCDLGSPLGKMPLFKEPSAEDGPAARGFRAGTIMIDSRSFPDEMEVDSATFSQVATVAEAQAVTADLLKRGVEVTKVMLDAGWPRGTAEPLSADQVRAVALEAHAHGMLTRAHCNDVDIWHIAVKGGVDAIEHIPIPGSFFALWLGSISAGQDMTGLADQLKGVFTPEELKIIEAGNDPVPDLLRIPIPEYDTWLPRMVEEHIALVPTFVRGPVGYLSEQPNLLPIQQGVAGAMFDIVRRFHTAGGTVVLGTDYCGGLNGPEMVMKEMRYLLKAGLSPMEAIQAGTKHAAFYSGMGEELGTLEPGKLADIIVVNGDPLTDIEALRRIAIVIKDGEVAFSRE
jgi:imidazolonepropionase-like amidohydrolase